MEHDTVEKAPVLLDFNGDEKETLRELESILYTSGWNHYVIIAPDVPSEDKLLLELIREGAVAVGELYYTFVSDFSEELRDKAYKYFHRLRKKHRDSIYMNAVNYFSRHEPDIEKTDNGALFYPDINAYVRCGDLSPTKLLELMQNDGCNRVIVFGGSLRQDKEQPWEVFHSFEMQAPKEYIMEKINEMNEEKLQKYYDIISKANDITPPIYDGK